MTGIDTSYRDARLPTGERVEILLSQMTLEEKAGLFFHAMISMGADGSLSDGDPVFHLPSNHDYVVGRHMNHFNLLTGATAERARAVLAPLRDLFAAAFFLAIGFAVSPAQLFPALPAALALALAGIATKIATGWYAARRDGIAPRGRLRAGTALVARGEFSVVIMSLAGATSPELGPVVTAYVLLLATIGPLITRWSGDWLSPPRARAPRSA